MKQKKKQSTRNRVRQLQYVQELYSAPKMLVEWGQADSIEAIAYCSYFAIKLEIASWTDI